MKKLHLLLLTLLTLTIGISVSAFGQKGTVKQITINSKGQLYSQDGTKLGYIDKNDVVRDNTGKGLYSIDVAGNVTAADGRKLGLAKKNGSYFDTKGSNVLNIKDVAGKDKCEILDPKGHNLGTTHKNYKLHACAAHCYWLTQAQQKAAPTH
jgi:hypothetical protein